MGKYVLLEDLREAFNRLYGNEYGFYELESKLKTYESTPDNEDSLYWAYFIMKDVNHIWVSATSTGFRTLENAMEEVEFKVAHYNVIMAWIDYGEGDTAKPVFHKCYLR